MRKPLRFFDYVSQKSQFGKGFWFIFGCLNTGISQSKINTPTLFVLIFARTIIRAIAQNIPENVSARNLVRIRYIKILRIKKVR